MLSLNDHAIVQDAWSLLKLLPTNPRIRTSVQVCGQRDVRRATEVLRSPLFDPTSVHQLLYSLRIVDTLACPPSINSRMPASASTSASTSTPRSVTLAQTGDADTSPDASHVEPSETERQTWCRNFLVNGGGAHLLWLLRRLNHQQRWKDALFCTCVAVLLKLLHHFAVTFPADDEVVVPITKLAPLVCSVTTAACGAGAGTAGDNPPSRKGVAAEAATIHVSLADVLRRGTRLFMACVNRPGCLQCLAYALQAKPVRDLVAALSTSPVERVRVVAMEYFSRLCTLPGRYLVVETAPLLLCGR